MRKLAIEEWEKEERAMIIRNREALSPKRTPVLPSSNLLSIASATDSSQVADFFIDSIECIDIIAKVLFSPTNGRQWQVSSLNGQMHIDLCRS